MSIEICKEEDEDNKDWHAYLKELTGDLFTKCMIGSKVDDAIAVLVYGEDSGDALKKRREIVEKCGVLKERVELILGSSIHIGIGAFVEVEDFRKSWDQACIALKSRRLDAVHYEDYIEDATAYDSEGEDYPATIKKAIDYIGENYMQAISLVEVASAVAVSPSYFSAVFKNTVGKGYVEYLTEIRIERAKELLKDGKSTVAVAACRVGYSDPTYFGRIFKRTVGMTPMEYQKSIK